MRTVLQTAATACVLVTAGIGVAPLAAQAAPTVVRACADTHTPGRMACMALRRATPATNRSAGPDASHGGYAPADLRSAYSVPTGAHGVTVAIVDAYNDPRAESDLTVYRSRYGLPDCTTANGCFRQVNQNGGTATLPANDGGWSGEISLDLDMVSAICPACHILLVEAASNEDGDLFAAISRAIAMGAKFVSNSWGGDEESDQTSLDAHLDHPGVAITVSTGDDGYGTEYPATSRFVTAVGGTSLKRSANARGWSETVWSNGGSGCSAYDARPSWQDVTTKCAQRADSDVSAVADPNTGVAVYQSYGGNGWSIYGGTSAAAPIVAAMYALAGTPNPGDYAASYPYANASHFHDVTSGHNGRCGSQLCAALAGWDGPTGLGTPDGVAAFARPSTCPSGNLLANGGFETGAATSWTASTSMIGSATPHSGTLRCPLRRHRQIRDRHARADRHDPGRLQQRVAHVLDEGHHGGDDHERGVRHDEGHGRIGAGRHGVESQPRRVRAGDCLPERVRRDVGEDPVHRCRGCLARDHVRAR